MLYALLNGVFVHQNELMETETLYGTVLNGRPLKFGTFDLPPSYLKDNIGK